MLQIANASVRSILILQTKFIGDVVLASTLARNLQLQYPGVSIVFLCEAGLAESAEFLQKVIAGIGSDRFAGPFRFDDATWVSFRPVSRRNNHRARA